MIDLEQVNDSMKEDIDSVNRWVSKIYDEQFGEQFKGVRELFSRLESTSHPITDEEVNWVLTTLPLQLFTVSESLSQLRTKSDVIKMKNKQKRAELIRESLETTATKRAEDADEQLLGNKLLASVYDNVIARVESEISFSRELIMTCKKLFDARRSTESVDPISESVIQYTQEDFDKGFQSKNEVPGIVPELGDIKVSF